MLDLKKSNLVLFVGNEKNLQETLALNVVINIGIRQNVPVLIFSTNENERKVKSDILDIDTMLDIYFTERNKMSKEYKDRLKEIKSNIVQNDIYVEDSQCISINEIEEKSRKMVQDKNVGLIVIDSLKFVVGSELEYKDRQEEIKEIIEKLEILSIELNVDIILTCDLKRNVNIEIN